MRTIKTKKGLDVPISGEPRQAIAEGPRIARVALLGDDYVGMKPTMEVAEGDSVRRGQLLFTDKKNPGVRYTSPAGGRVAEINRGAKRRFLSVVVDVDGDESVEFERRTDADVATLSAAAVREQLLESGLWTAFRTRPFSKVPAVDAQPSSVFVTAADTHPLAADPAVVIADRQSDWLTGLRALARMDLPVHVCKGAGDLPLVDDGQLSVTSFDGPHPSGLAGTHIHFLDPVDTDKTVWWIGYQDVIAIGEMYRTGEYPSSRVVSLAGPAVTSPELLRSRVGASVVDLTRERLQAGDNRIVSGSVLGGRTAGGEEAYLGRYHTQVSCLAEGTEREFLGWMMPGLDKFSLRRIFASAVTPSRRFAMSTSTQGSPRAMVPIGMYEDVMPLDIIPTYLLRALIVGDTDQAQALGALELDEEDLALCTFVCPGKYEYGPALRENLTRIEKEG